MAGDGQAPGARLHRCDRLGPELERYDVFLDRLSEKARADVCWRTAECIYGGNKGKVAGHKPAAPLSWAKVLASS